VYVRRAYISYELTCLQLLELSGEISVIHFQFLLPSSHPNRYHITPQFKYERMLEKQNMNTFRMVLLLCGVSRFLLVAGTCYVSFSWPWFLWLSILVADLLLWRSEFDPRPVHVGFVVGKVTLGQVSFSCHFHFTSAPDSFIHLSPMLHNLSIS
jgi:hypothetical protein